VSNVLIDQSSVVSFIEHNWGLPPLGNAAADNEVGSIDDMFNFSHPTDPPLYLDPTSGEPVGLRHGFRSFGRGEGSAKVRPSRARLRVAATFSTASWRIRHAGKWTSLTICFPCATLSG
jgi:hypothetical protein